MEETNAIPALTAAEMARVDRILMDDLGLDVLQLMEVAGRAVGVFARDRFLNRRAEGRRILVLAGSGNNGGDGLVAARFLHAWGAEVEVWLTHDPAALRSSDRSARRPMVHQLAILETMGVPAVAPASNAAGSAEISVALPEADLLIDALLGFGLNGPPAGAVADLVGAANAHPAPILAVDVPSGLDATTGAAYVPCIHAAATLTLALPKTGLLLPAARPVVGELHLADIGIPPAVYTRLGHAPGPIFSSGDTIRLR
ncbi:MAG: NAD(P)H-hydrate epimerase [Chloroflexota bacterium]|nr:NAD(P)H-hydrate epimerase [Chloroflexota bacterium]